MSKKPKPQYYHESKGPSLTGREYLIIFLVVGTVLFLGLVAWVIFR